MNTRWLNWIANVSVTRKDAKWFVKQHSTEIIKPAVLWLQVSLFSVFRIRNSGEGGIRTLGTELPVRQFPARAGLISATHPPHHNFIYKNFFDQISLKSFDPQVGRTELPVRQFPARAGLISATHPPHRATSLFYKGGKNKMKAS